MKRITIYTAIAAIALTGCAKEATKNQAAKDKAYFEAWAEIHEGERAGNGIYILEDIPGEGEALDMDATPYVFVDYTITDLEGNVLGTTFESVAKRIGEYNLRNWYGPQFWLADEGLSGIYAGVEDMLSGMKLGGRRKAAIPYWLCTTDRYFKEETYLDKATSGSNYIYDVTLLDACENIYEYEGEQLDLYSKEHLEGVDSTHIAGDEELDKFGFYFKTLPKAGVDLEYEMPDDTTMYLNYTGKFLNGKVFDTTIENVAKDAGIYHTSRSYGPVQITRSATYTNIALGGSSDLCSGFQAAIYMMHPMEKAVTAFYSLLGYGVSGSGQVIPPYTPLVFELELVEKPE